MGWRAHAVVLDIGGLRKYRRGHDHLRGQYNIIWRKQSSLPRSLCRSEPNELGNSRRTITMRHGMSLALACVGGLAAALSAQERIPPPEPDPAPAGPVVPAPAP